MKKYLSLFLILIISVGLISCSVEAQSSSEDLDEAKTLVTYESQPELSTISVNGSGEVEVSPDTAKIYANILAESKTLSDAKNQAYKTNNQILKDLEKVGLTEKDIKSTPSISYIRDYRKNPEISSINSSPNPYPLVGYRVNISLNIKTNDMESLEDITRILSRHNNITMGNFRFTLEDNSEGYDKALEMAMEDAKRKATLSAKLADTEIVKVHKLTVNSQNNNYYPYYRADASFSKAESTEPNISTGSNKVSVNVSVIYQIK